MLSAAQDKQTIYILWRCCKQVVFNEALNDQTSSILDQLNLPNLSTLSKWTQFLVIVNEHNFAAREYYISLFGCTCNKILILNFFSIRSRYHPIRQIILRHWKCTLPYKIELNSPSRIMILITFQKPLA